jgi:hypothetical protein
MHGLNLFNILIGLPFALVTHNVGNVDSIGNAVFLAGSRRYATAHSTFMFHGVGFDIPAQIRLEEKNVREHLDGILSNQQRIGSQRRSDPHGRSRNLAGIPALGHLVPYPGNLGRFMFQFNQEHTARRIQPSQFDTVLPPDARSELLHPPRARILTRPPEPPQKAPRVDSARRSWWHPALGWLLALAGLVAVIAVSWPSPEKRERARQESAARNREVEAKAQEALKALRTPSTSAPQNVAPLPAPAALPPGWNADGTAYGRAGVIPEVRRAELVRLPAPPPRAQLVRLPSPRVSLVQVTAEHIDETHRITMPYGTQVLATLRGFLGTENQLPRVGHIGDMFVVGAVPWIWVQVPGTTAPTWVDP